MNPITNAKNLNKLNERELQLGLTGSKTSWHNLYEESAWIFVGGLAYDLTEGDIIAVFSQYGEIVNINMVRDKKTGKTKGYCFICYEDQRSTNLAVDNFNGIKLLNRILRVDHVKDYRLPKELDDEDEVTKQLRAEGCGPQMQHAMEATSQSPEEKTEKKKKKKLKIKKEEFSESDGETDNRRERMSSRRQVREIKQDVSEMADRSSGTDSETRQVPVKVKTEPLDRGYERNEGREKSPENDRHRKDTYQLKLNAKPNERSTIDSGYEKRLKCKESGLHGAYRNLEGNERQRNLDRERQRHHDDDGRERVAYDKRPREEDLYKGHRESVTKDTRSERLSDDENARSWRRETEGDRGTESRRARDSKCRNIDHQDDYSRKRRDDRVFASAKEYRKRSHQDRSSDGSRSPSIEDKRSRKRR